MKKFIIPEVSLVELAENDVIMASNLQIGTVNYTGYTQVASDVKSDFEMWKGFNNAQ